MEHCYLPRPMICPGSLAFSAIPSLYGIIECEDELWTKITAVDSNISDGSSAIVAK